LEKPQVLKQENEKRIKEYQSRKMSPFFLMIDIDPSVKERIKRKCRI